MPINQSFTVFDLETTGLDPKRGHRVIEIAGVRIEGGQITDKTFTSFVNPERDIPWEAKQVNHIDEKALVGAPTIMEVLPQFLEFAQGTILFAHNAAFDHGFLMTEKECCWGYVELPECFCTMKLSQSLFPEAFRHNLDSLIQRFALQPPVDRHRALPDVIVTAQALLKMIDHGKIQSLDELRRRSALMQAASVR